ncbi:isoprenylcysteine carboxylmethyltransferase family protein [Litoribacillus peritrichatus]|uniref:Isoprenylcysteine carboxylmethyltransferase family protein n=1 Tax=Litoribacillus peritrichatus TaxID=718191 RepID=A0ABP7MGV1_9GAMM
MDLKIPPLLVMFLMILGQVELSDWVPLLSFPEMPIWLPVLWMVFGGVICLLAVVEVKRRKTTVDPRKPESSSSLVTQGIYQYSRNPMYLGMALFLVGTGFYFADISCMLAVIFFVLYIQRFQIMPEEEILKKTFGDDYSNYQNSTRPWL